MIYETLKHLTGSNVSILKLHIEIVHLIGYNKIVYRIICGIDNSIDFEENVLF